MINLLTLEIRERNKNIIQSTSRRNHVLTITLSNWTCEAIGIQDADVYVDFLYSDADEKATQIAVCWLPKGAAEHEGRIEHLNYDDIVNFFGSYTLFESKCDQEKLIQWIAKASTEDP